MRLNKYVYIRKSVLVSFSLINTMKHSLDLPDKELIKQYCELNSSNAATALYKRHHSTVEKIVTSKITQREECEDITQEIFLHVFNKLKNRYTETGQFHAWLKRLTYNYLNDYFRRNQNAPQRNERYRMDRIPASPNVTPLLIKLEKAYDAMDEIIELCSKREQEMLTLHFYQNLSYQKIADEMGIKKPTCAKRLTTLCVKIKKQMQPKGFKELPDALKRKS